MRKNLLTKWITRYSGSFRRVCIWWVGIINSFFTHNYSLVEGLG